MLDSKKQISNKVIWGTVVLEWEIYFAIGRVFSSTTDRFHFLSL